MLPRRSQARRPLGGKPGGRGLDALVACFNEGLLVRVTSDIIALSPPLIIEKGQIDHLVEVLSRVIREVA